MFFLIKLFPPKFLTLSPCLCLPGVKLHGEFIKGEDNVVQGSVSSAVTCPTLFLQNLKPNCVYFSIWIFFSPGIKLEKKLFYKILINFLVFLISTILWMSIFNFFLGLHIASNIKLRSGPHLNFKPASPHQSKHWLFYLCMDICMFFLIFKA